jgi:cyclophilin family peptidyl-prolyl cis-trans isomerase/HEAT repeat protein
MLLHAQLGRTTPLFVCGHDEMLSEEIPLRWYNVVLAGDGRLYSPCQLDYHLPTHREVRESDLLQLALRVPNVELKRLAVQAFGRMGTPITALLFITRRAPGMTGAALVSAPGTVTDPTTTLLDDPDARVRREVASAIADLLSGPIESPMVLTYRPPAEGLLESARLALVNRLSIETDDNVAATILESVGRMQHVNEPVKNVVEALLVAQSPTKATRLLGAARGLDAFLHNNPGRAIGELTRERLRQWAAIGPTQAEVPTIAGPGTAEAPGDEASLARVRRLALTMMADTKDDHLETLLRAVHDADWQVRRLVAARADVTHPDLLAAFELLAADAAFQVRYEAVAALARRAVQTHDCSRLVRMAGDAHPVVAMRAIDLLPEQCIGAEDIASHLLEMAERLKEGGRGVAWQLPVRALVALARLDPARAVPLMEPMSQHSEWPVRAAAATAAGHLHDESTLAALAHDREANVRSAALDAMVAAKSGGVTAAAIDALESDDYHLLRTAAHALKDTPESGPAANALILALYRVTRAASDTSRAPRLAMLDRIEQIGSAEHAGQLTLLSTDFDRTVVAAAASAMAKLNNLSPPTGASAQVRYPLQPTIEQLQDLPRSALVNVEGTGTIELALLPNQAPVTVARFTELVRAGYYNGRMFHRLLPNFIIQTGSPADNDDAGTDRFWRDEISTEPHTRGAVSLVTHGRDTGNGQFFIDLVDVPRFDHDRTVFARVMSGYDVIDRLLEGARISTISVR